MEPERINAILKGAFDAVGERRMNIEEEGEPSLIYYRFNGSVNPRYAHEIIENMWEVSTKVPLPELFRDRRDVVRTVTYEGIPLTRYSVTDEIRLKKGEGIMLPSHENMIVIGREYKLVDGEMRDVKLDWKGNTERIIREYRIKDGEIVDFDLDSELNKHGLGC